MSADIVAYSSGRIGTRVCVQSTSGGRWSEGGQYASEELAERSVLAEFDDFVPVFNSMQIEAVALVKTYGPFVKKAELAELNRLTRMVSTHGYYSEKRLKSAMASVRERAAAVLETAPDLRSIPKDGITDEQIASAVRHLTGLDQDHAGLANKVGWNAAHSKLGHWACAHLETHPDQAIAVARGFTHH